MVPQLRLPRAFRPPAQINLEEGTNGHPETNRGRSAHNESEDGIGDGNEEKSDGPNPEPVGFWHPDLRQVRNRAFVKWIITTSFLMAFVLAVLSIYWGVFFQVENRISNLLVYVVDMDGVAPYNTRNAPFVGPTITQLVQQQLRSGQPTLGWGIRPASDFNNDPIQVRQAIYEWDAWAAIVINPNASALLYSAIANGNASYDPLGACQLIYQDSRDDRNWFDFMLPIISPFMTEAQSMVGQQWAQMVLQNASDPSILSNMQNSPQAINPAIGFSKYNLRPFSPYTSIPAVSIGLISSLSTCLFTCNTSRQPTNHPPLKFRQLVIWRWCATLSAYFMLSLAYSFVSMAFQINFWDTNSVTSHTQVTIQGEGNPVAFGNATFVVYWMLNFCGMVALGLACENIAMIVGMPWMGLFLIFWVITNVSTAFYDIEIAPAFYRWGYAWPLHSIVQGSRTILFDLHSRLGLDFGILIAWGAVNTFFFPFCCWFMRWKTQRGVNEYWPLD